MKSLTVAQVDPPKKRNQLVLASAALLPEVNAPEPFVGLNVNPGYEHIQREILEEIARRNRYGEGGNHRQTAIRGGIVVNRLQRLSQPTSRRSEGIETTVCGSHNLHPSGGQRQEGEDGASGKGGATSADGPLRGAGLNNSKQVTITAGKKV